MHIFRKAIAILSGGNQRKDDLITPRESALFRTNRAFREWETNGEKDLLITTTLYSPNLPPLLDKDGFPVSEAEAMADYLIRLGVPANFIRMDQKSVCTLSNLYEISMICEVYSISKLIIVTSEFHGPRAVGLADFVFSLENNARRYKMILSDNGEIFTEEEIQKRAKKEKDSLKIILNKLKIFGVKTLYDLYRYLLETHDYYMVGRQPLRMTRELGEKMGY